MPNESQPRSENRHTLQWLGWSSAALGATPPSIGFESAPACSTSGSDTTCTSKIGFTTSSSELSLRFGCDEKLITSPMGCLLGGPAESAFSQMPDLHAMTKF